LMEGYNGYVVRSLCGRDRKRVFLIVGISPEGSGRVLVADGKLHTLEKPKKKNLAHLAVLAAAGEEGTSFRMDSDREIASYLESFEKEYGKK